MSESSENRKVTPTTIRGSSRHPSSLEDIRNIVKYDRFDDTMPPTDMLADWRKEAARKQGTSALGGCARMADSSLND